jgi:hypothetical protein
MRGPPTERFYADARVKRKIGPSKGATDVIEIKKHMLFKMDGSFSLPRISIVVLQQKFFLNLHAL